MKIRTSRFIGGQIKKRRKELGISQEKLAETLGVTYQQIQRYENGTNKLNVENIQVIANALDIPVSVFFDNTKPKAQPSSEEGKLLRYFKGIENRDDKNLITQLTKRFSTS